MKSVIGLLGHEGDAAQTVDRLKSAGYQNDAIQIVTSENAVRKLFGCDPLCIAGSYAAAGAGIVAAIYGVFAVAASLCECNLMGFGSEFGTITLLGGLLAGAFVGGGLGLLVGAAEAEKDTQFFVQGVRMGDPVIALQVKDEDVEKARRVLRKEKVSGVRVV